MKTEVTVPSVGESITTGVIVSWLKRSGDQVREGENIFELETDKAVLEIPSPAAGTLEILVEEGNEVSIGQTVATLSSEKETKQPSAPPEEKPPPKPEQKVQAESQPAKEAAPAKPALLISGRIHQGTPRRSGGSGLPTRIWLFCLRSTVVWY